MGDELTNENITWSELLEEYFASVGEKAHCLSWLHSRAESLYSQRRSYIDLPVIVLSGITGFCSVGSSTMFEGNMRMASILLGVSSLVVSILNTISSYYQWSKKAEGHRISALHYGKLYRFICVEMGLPRSERIRATDLLKFVKDSYDRLAETSPQIPPESIAEFRARFNDKKYDDISKPEAANGLEKITVFEQTLKRRATAQELKTPKPQVQTEPTEPPKHIQAPIHSVESNETIVHLVEGPD
jgi:hypothetical protein